MKRAVVIIGLVWAGCVAAMTVALFYVLGEDDRNREIWGPGSDAWEEQ